MVWDWNAAGRRADRAPIVVAIVNVTPDSFSDGGTLYEVDAAQAYAARALDEGADILDVGGESTRPGATPVPVDEEIRRVVPVIEAIVARYPDAAISVDTTKAAVAGAALDAGARIVNDVSAGRLDPALLEACAERGAGVILMHSRGSVATMARYDHATYDDVVAEVRDELAQSVEHARAAGVARESIVIDPGIGFAKRSEQSLAVLANLDRIATLGYPVLVGVSRKRVIGELTGRDVPAERLWGTVGANVAALARGARLFRVHDVQPHREALDAAWGVMHAGG